MPPNGAVRRFLPSIAERSVSRREYFKVSVCIRPHHGFRNVAVLGFRKGGIPGFPEALPHAPTEIGRQLPYVPKSVIRTHDKEFLASVPVSSHGQAIGMPDSGAGLTQSRPVAPAAVRRG